MISYLKSGIPESVEIPAPTTHTIFNILPVEISFTNLSIE